MQIWEPCNQQESEVQLTDHVAEFRTALREEIEAGKRDAASSAISLLNGRKIAQIGSAFQYLFDIENVLNLPGDTPADLRVPGKPSLEATIISIEGMAITLSVAADLGHFVSSASLQSNMTLLLRKLISRIEAIGNLENSAGDRILGIRPFFGEPVSLNIPGFHPYQTAAVAASLGLDTAFIWGPPGTGKTYTIGEIGAQLFSRGASLLLVSHTNSAVDQALLKIADKINDNASLEAGKVLRIGDPKDKRVTDNPELLLQTHIDRRSHELVARWERLTLERENIEKQIKRLSRLIDLCEWVEEAQQDIQSLASDLDALLCLEKLLEEVSLELEQLLSRRDFQEISVREARRCAAEIDQLAMVESRIHETEAKINIIKQSLQALTKELTNARLILEKSEEIEPSRLRLLQLPSEDIQLKRKQMSGSAFSSVRNALSACKKELEQAQQMFIETNSVGRMKRLWMGLPSPDEQKQKVEELKKQFKETEITLTARSTSLANDERLLDEIISLKNQIADYANIPKLEEQKSVVSSLYQQVQDAQGEASKLHANLSEDENVRDRMYGDINEFVKKYGSTPADVLLRYNEFKLLLNQTEEKKSSLLKQYGQMRQRVVSLLRQRLFACQSMKLCNGNPSTEEEMFAAIQSAYQKALDELSGLDLENLRRERNTLNQRIYSIEVEIKEIEDALKKVEELVVADAFIVATTLTRAYLRDSIQKRKFDTVILDEASMAPIPALWVAASLADRAITVVGDFKQLPPIVLSENNMAKKWLGTDIFEHAGFTSINTSNPSSFPTNFVALTEQHRMHPAISTIPNTFFYQILTNHLGHTNDDSSLDDWYRYDWGHDSPVLLVDTEKADAWVTSVSYGQKASRLNFLSASICVDIAEQLLRNDRKPIVAGDSPRILLASPYRPHSRLLELLVNEQGLHDDVRAGTAHTFQGAEADVVIFDLVNDTPHWRVAMLIPNYDEATKRLLNVALTRARRRLIIVADFNYLATISKKSFLGSKLIPYLLKHYPIVDALDIVPSGLAARSAKAQAAILGGVVEPETDRIVVTQEHFFNLFRGDIQKTKRRIVIYSPFITQNRLGYLETLIRAAIERGVNVFVITKARQERLKSQRSEYGMLERTLGRWGVVIVHKKGMHEKLVFVDDSIVWSGSLNPLSFSDTQEVMERRDNKKVFEDYAKTLRMFELISEFSDEPPRCPYCDDEVIASEGNREPFYWRCINDDCYSRGIDQPRVDGGKVTCSNCGGEVEFGEWGKKPAWRCIENRHHYQKIAKSHLRLPKMREIIPKDELVRLDKIFDISLVPTQRSLFS